MSDIGDDFAALKKIKTAKKKSNLEYSTARLDELGVSYESKNNGVHLIVFTDHGIVDFWPSTGKFHVRDSGRYDRGLKNLLKLTGK